MSAILNTMQLFSRDMVDYSAAIVALSEQAIHWASLEHAKLSIQALIAFEPLH